MYKEKFPELPIRFEHGLHKVLYIGLLLREFGCKYKNGSERNKISDFFTIPAGNFEMSWQMIADGRAVVATFMCHEGLYKLKFGEVYDSSSVYHPKRKSKELMAHAVILIGAISFGPLQIDIFLNSYGEQFCARRNAAGEIVIGGIGMVLGTRYCNPVVLCRSWEQVVKGRLEGSWMVDVSETEQLLSTTHGKRGLENISCIVGAGPTKAVYCARDETKIFNDGSVLKARADAAFYEEDYARASALYTEAIESGSNDLMLYVMRSLCCFHMGDEAKGLHDAYKYEAMKGDCFEHGPALIMMEACVQSCKLDSGSEGSEPTAQASREKHL